MKVGDLVNYKYIATDGVVVPNRVHRLGLILYVNEEGGTLKVLDSDGQVDWYVTSYCEIVNENR
jgi:hypothetical protein